MSGAVEVLPVSPAPSALHVKAAEEALLAALLAGASLQDAALPPGDLGDPIHRIIYEAIRAVVGRFKASDRSNVRAELEAQDASPKVLEALEILTYTPHRMELVPSYVAQIQEAAARRRAVVLAEQVRQAAQDGSVRLDVVLRSVANELGTLGFIGREPEPEQDIIDLEADIIDAVEALEKGETAPKNHLLLPFTCWNDDPDGLKGLPHKKRGCNVAVLAARAGQGKTSTIATWIKHFVIDQKMRVGIVGLEDGTRWLLSRLMAHAFRLDWQQMEERLPEMLRNAARFDHLRGKHPETGAVLDIPEALDYFKRLYRERIRRWDAPIRSAELVSLVKRWRDDGIGLVFVDHGLRINYDRPREERLDWVIGKTWQDLADISAGDAGAPPVTIVVAWHLNRTQLDGSIPTMGDIKESGQVDGTSSLILGCWKDPSTGRRLLNVAKTRGCGADGHIIDLHFAGRSGLLDCSASQLVNMADLRAEAKAKKGKVEA